MIVEEEKRIRVMEGEWDPVSVARDVIEGGQEDPFYVMDVGEVVARYRQWKELMPRVEPFYAVKCNDDKLLVRTLAALGTGFDCASKAEIELVTSIGVKPERIIFANPAKMASHIKYSSNVGVDTMTFDSETELMKIKQLMPHAKLVVRIRCDATEAQCPLGIKFGCDPVTEAPRLLKLAAVLGLQVIGVSFHVGSGALETAVYHRAIQYCRALFAMGADVGHDNMRLLDIGGGFPGGYICAFVILVIVIVWWQVSQVINSALETYFNDMRVRVIAEPGRYFAAAAYTLFTMVHAKREITQKDVEGLEEAHTMYFINDGVYGSFNCVLYDHQEVTAELMEESGGKPASCSVWGPSCDGLDCVVGRARLPPVAVGRWLVFRDMGAYTLPVASPFNGFPVPTVRAHIDASLWSALVDSLPLSEANFCRASATPPPAAVYVECALK
ncbi:hypothetical protein ACJJTC_008181 [Scirpophaga incertulas]